MPSVSALVGCFLHLLLEACGGSCWAQILEFWHRPGPHPFPEAILTFQSLVGRGRVYIEDCRSVERMEAFEFVELETVDNYQDSGACWLTETALPELRQKGIHPPLVFSEGNAEYKIWHGRQNYGYTRHLPHESSLFGPIWFEL